jgi:hypothetical protein
VLFATEVPFTKEFDYLVYSAEVFTLTIVDAVFYLMALVVGELP